jgi:hypothetical protein
MARSKPTAEEWRELYQAAERLREAAPWEWMAEADVFGVQNPETQQLGFVSISGALGQHYAASVYLGVEGLSRFWKLEDGPDGCSPEELLNVPQLHASFEDRDQLSKEDRDVIKELGLKFRGRNAWPLFRSYRPGYCPWFLEPAEVRFLTHAVQQAVDVALRFREDAAILAAPNEDRYLVRVPRHENGAWVWEDQVMDVPSATKDIIHIVVDGNLLGAARRWPRSDATIEVDVFLMPGCVGERGERPFLAYDLLVVDGATGLILATEMLDPRPGLLAMWGSVPEKLLHLLSTIRVLPGQVRVSNRLLYTALRPVADELGFSVSMGATPGADEARQTMIDLLSR